MSQSTSSEAVTDGIRIQAAAQYLPEESKASEGKFVFAYKITMTNLGEQRARLVARHWIIVDSEGRRQDVRGPGVVGEHPVLGHRESYSYISYCPLHTQWGTMEGSYMFERDDGKRFRVRCGRFYLVPTAPPLSLESPA
jgi:ApaG protein